MKKENLIAQLEAAKALSSQVDIDKVIALIQQLEQEQKQVKVFGITEDLAATINDKIQRVLDHNSSDFVDRDSANFEISYDNRIELTDCDIDIYEVMRHVEAVVAEFVLEEDEEEDDAADQPAPGWNGTMYNEEGILKDIEEE